MIVICHWSFARRLSSVVRRPPSAVRGRIHKGTNTMNHPLPIVQSIPHGGLQTPPEVADRLAIDEVTIYNECDLWADQIFDFDHPDLADLRPAGLAASTLGAVRMPVARVLIDRGLIVGNQRTDTPIQPPNQERIAAVRRRLYRWLLALLES